ncbi:MAG: DUF2520 domain-containing protein [Muribaculaceae bacterium]|nr:DUF2520 domain-containing protein [Muribaculaceae bacterium]
MNRKKVALLGAGNVGYHFFHTLKDKVNFVQVFSRNPENALELCRFVKGCRVLHSIDEIDRDIDVVIIAVKDDAISQVAEKLASITDKKFRPLIFHTSGTTSVNADVSYLPTKMGVLYPLQTFTKNIPLDLSKVHFFVAGSGDKHINSLKEFALLVSENVHLIRHEDLPALHLAAVFSCNFANHVWSIADRILHGINLDFSIMENIVKTTFDKAISVGPHNGQTGPARRVDHSTISRHASMLDGLDAKIYDILTSSIINEYHPSNDDLLQNE